MILWGFEEGEGERFRAKISAVVLGGDCFRARGGRFRVRGARRGKEKGSSDCPLARRMNPFFIPRPQKCSPHLAQNPHALPTQPKHHRRVPKALPFSLLETPQNHPFARAEKAASVNSYIKPAISYNAPPKVLPLTGACLPLHCHQDRNEIQIKK